MRLIRFMTLILSILSVLIVHSQDPLYKIHEFKLNGSKTRITSVCIDSLGILWCGTEKGLFSFTGTEFIPYKWNDSLDNKIINTVHTDSKGRIWAGMKNGKLGMLTSKGIIWQKIDDNFGNSPVSDIEEDAAGSFLCSTEGGGLIYFSGDSSIRITTNHGLSDNYCYSILPLADGSVLTGTDQGINRIKFESGKWQVSVFSSEDGLPDNIVRHLSMDQNGLIWAGMQDKGFCRLEYINGSLRMAEQFNSWSYGQINFILPLSKSVWIGTEKKGIISADYSGGFSPLFEKDNNLKSMRAAFALRDHDNNIWTISGHRLVRTSGEIWQKLESDSELKIHSVHSILADSKGNVWFSPDQQLYKAWQVKPGKLSYKKYFITNKNKLTDIVSLYEDPYGMIWIGTLGEGVYILDPQTNKVIKLKDDIELNEGSILTINGKDNEVWIAGFGGILKLQIAFEKNSRKLNITYPDQSALETLKGDYIYYVFTDSKSKTWIGTDEKGLVQYSNGKLRFFNKEDGLPGNTIVSIDEDKNGKIWLACIDAGIASYDGNRFKIYSVRNGLSDINCSSILCDKNGKVIITHANGVDIFDTESETFQYYSSESGMGELNPDLNTVSHGHDGRVWIGTERGIFIFNTSVSTWKQTPVWIKSVSLFLQEIDFNSLNRFSHDQNNFTFEFGSVWYNDPGRIRFSYILEGYSEDWQESKDESASYPRLAPGKYTFKVRSSLNNHFHSSPEASYSFIITQPFWKQWWFRIIISLALALMIYKLIRRREQRLKREQKLAEERLQFRFDTLRNQVNPHFLFNSFNTLITVIEKNPGKAINYVENLSEFFRNIIAYKDKSTIPLTEELELLSNYLYLQKSRYGENLSLNIKVSEDEKNQILIPPLSLQMLAENALKHNAISHETPLKLEVEIENDFLIVKNNMNKKFGTEKSTGTGLQNIISRYKLLCGKDVMIRSDEKQFKVMLPVIRKNTV
ncbi:MAG: hypothetical protein DWQ44_11700 [Bacteroidetes bacterium]|nr:MAG: hypothetical protein DWQ33_10665 [Bacteroidota bacterium]REK05285.1 MAG: hypothetical protein DWQ39_08830 [Bacteroidota bacterium]REK32690.1 MAG: hypothetical protein DWQ44_11700 [Bacteroidota bacterium]REK48863.1 MAG: hypothetical protein DWQ48_08260 [Bacteroidota bacterium]